MSKTQKKALIFTAAVCALCLLIMAAALIISELQKPEFVPPSFDTAAQPGVPSPGDELAYAELDAEAYRVGVCSRPSTDGNSCVVWLTNPDGNSVWMKLRILDSEGKMLGESGLIRPGECLRSVDIAAALPSGTPVSLKIMAYEPETYYSAGSISVNATIG